MNMVSGSRIQFSDAPGSFWHWQAAPLVITVAWNSPALWLIQGAGKMHDSFRHSKYLR